jgi:hypothetical protein
MHVVYIDESSDPSAGVTTISALMIPAEHWAEGFAQIRRFRLDLKQTDGVYVQKELHAWKLVSGRGAIATGIVTKSRRCEIFKEHLTLIARLPGVRVFNAVFPTDGVERAMERLLNRFNTCASGQDSHFLVVCDQGKDALYTRLARRMRVYNPIPSRYGAWDDDRSSTKSIPLSRMIEDPFFKDSKQSYFIQLADMCCYALLRREFPVPSRSRYGVDTAFGLLGPALCREASGKDPEGILRP